MLSQAVWSSIRETRHDGGDDLLTAGLGLAGLRSALPPPDPGGTLGAMERRRRAIWHNWRGIADTSPGGGLGEVHGDLSLVPGREFHAFDRLAGARWPHRVLLQLPDHFDTDAPCLVVAASSGSRGIYGAIAVAGGWALPRGCAVVTTDKGAGTEWVDLTVGGGNRLDGGPADSAAEACYWQDAAPSALPTLAIKHAHSGDHPEADWGQHVARAVAFGRACIAATHGEAVAARLVVIGLSVSNGAGALLRAAALPDSGLDGIVAACPNIWAGEGGRPLVDYGSEAALWMPAALASQGLYGALPMAARWHEQAARMGVTPETALARLQSSGWTLPALRAGVISVQMDLWRSVGAGYACAYLRRGPWDMPCGYRYAVVDAGGNAVPSTPAQRHLWWSDTPGMPPSPGIALLDGQPGADGALAALQGLRELWTGASDDASSLRLAVDATRAGMPREGLPIMLLHGLDDGLIPEAFSSAPYARWVQAQGRPLRYWRVAHAQHFDNALGLPHLAAAYLPMLPYAWRAADLLHAHLRQGTPLGGDREIRGIPRGRGDGEPPALRPEHLGI